MTKQREGRNSVATAFDQYAGLFPSWEKAGVRMRLWISYWPKEAPAVHVLKLASLLVHPYGLQVESKQPLSPGTSLHVRLLLPPMTAISAEGRVLRQEKPGPSSPFWLTIQFARIRERDRQRLAELLEQRCRAYPRRLAWRRIRATTSPPVI
ncbi:MAG: hypothetical protein D6704_07305 [Nitrospirae bacterium]|nr:MAG: hypothetical protein D6704_07305 [Nitrospirota bacterium]